jgi:ankyrin repeat protein
MQRGTTVLHAAAAYGHVEVMRQLLDRGASPVDVNSVGHTVSRNVHQLVLIRAT